MKSRTILQPHAWFSLHTSEQAPMVIWSTIMANENEHNKTTKQQDNKTTRQQDHKTTRPQDHKTTTTTNHNNNQPNQPTDRPTHPPTNQPTNPPTHRRRQQTTATTTTTTTTTPTPTATATATAPAAAAAAAATATATGENANYMNPLLGTTLADLSNNDLWGAAPSVRFLTGSQLWLGKSQHLPRLTAIHLIFWFKNSNIKAIAINGESSEVQHQVVFLWGSRDSVSCDWSGVDCRCLHAQMDCRPS